MSKKKQRECPKKGVLIIKKKQTLLVLHHLDEDACGAHELTGKAVQLLRDGGHHQAALRAVHRLVDGRGQCAVRTQRSAHVRTVTQSSAGCEPMCVCVYRVCAYVSASVYVSVSSCRLFVSVAS